MKKQALLLLVMVSVALAACGGGANVEFPYGSFKSRGGRYLTFTEDGTWSFALVEGQPVVTGEITVEGDQIAFGDETPAEGQNVPTCDQGHTYTWSYQDETLKFEPNGDDPCDHRAGDLGASFFPSD